MTDRVKLWLDSPMITRVTKIIAIISLLASLIVGAKQYALATCLKDYNQRVSLVNTQRAKATEDDRKSLDDMISGIIDARSLTPDQAKVAVDKAFLTYVKARAKADGQREANPLEPPPSQACG